MSRAQSFFEEIRKGATLRDVGSRHGLSISGVKNSLRRAGLPQSFAQCQRAGVAVEGAVLVRNPRQPGRKKKSIRSWAGYANALQRLRILPRTVPELAEALQCDPLSLQIIVTRMHDLGLVHAIDWRAPTRNGLWVPVWGFGKHGSVPCPNPKQCVRRPIKGYRQRPELIAFANIFRALAREPMTCLQLVHETGCTRNNLERLMLHCEKLGLTRVAAWEPREDGAGRPSMLWALSSVAQGRAPRPPVLTRKEIEARYRARAAAARQAKALMAAFAAPAVSAACEPALEAA